MVSQDNPTCPACGHYNAILNGVCRDCGYKSVEATTPFPVASLSLEAPGGPLRVWGRDEDHILCFWYPESDREQEGFTGLTGYVTFDDVGAEHEMRPHQVVEGYALPPQEVAVEQLRVLWDQLELEVSERKKALT